MHIIRFSKDKFLIYLTLVTPLQFQLRTVKKVENQSTCGNLKRINFEKKKFLKRSR